MKKKPPVVKKHIVNVGVSALARECGVTPAAISQKMKKGQTPEQIRADFARRQGRAPSGPGRPPTSSEYELVLQGRERLDRLDEMKFRRAKALAERQEIENALRRGELMPVAYVRRWGAQFLTDGRDTLLAGPSELADTLAAETDPLKVAEILRAWLERAMGKFHQIERLWGATEEEQVA